MQRIFYCIGLAIMLLSGTSIEAKAVKKQLTLVKHGKPKATIVLAAKPCKAAQLGAYELQQHVKLITGAELPIVREEEKTSKGVTIYIGESKAVKKLGLKNKDFKNQEYLIRFLPNAIILTGRDKNDFDKVVYNIDDPKKISGLPSWWDEIGSLYAVYDFLEQFCKVRWFAPNEFGMHYTKTKDLIVHGKNIRRQPFFSYREINGEFGDPGWYDSKTQLLSYQTPPTEFKKWQKLAYPKLYQKYSGNNILASRNLGHLFLLRMRNGGKRRTLNHSFYGYYDRFLKKSSDYLRAKSFVKKRPEFFAKGYGSMGTPPQLCYTNPELIKQVAQDARDYFDGKKTWKDLRNFWEFALPDPFPLAPMDNKFYCKCKQCQVLFDSKGNSEFKVFSTGEHSRYLLTFANKVVKEVRKTHPNAKFQTWGYATTAKLPKGFKLEPNIDIQFAFSTNRMPYDRPGYENELKLLKEWVDDSQKNGYNIYLWLYYCFPRNLASASNFNCFPGFFAHTIDKQFKLFHKYGIRGMFHCGYGQDVESYVTFKLMDDPTQSLDTLLDEYFTGMYGAAAKPMREFYEEVEKIYSNPANYPKTKPGHQNEIYAWGYLGTKQRMNELNAIMARAKKAIAKTNSIQKKRFELFDLAIWQYMKAGRKKYSKRVSAEIPRVTIPRVKTANGNPAKVNWEKTVMIKSWYRAGGNTPASRKFTGKIAHDAKYLYIKLKDKCDTKKLISSGKVFPCDDWEVFVAKQRALPYRQYAVNPDAKVVALSHGEVNWRKNVIIPKHNVKAISDKSSSRYWVVYLVIPLKDIVLGGTKPGETIYMNIFRVASKAVAKCKTQWSVDSWGPYCNPRETDRMVELTLEK